MKNKKLLLQSVLCELRSVRQAAYTNVLAVLVIATIGVLFYNEISLQRVV